MRHFIMLCCSSLLFLLTTSISTPPRLDTMKNNFKLLADTALIRIQKLTDEFRISPNMVFSGVEFIPNITLDKPLGLSSVVEKLNTFQDILLNLPQDGIPQVQKDITGLLDILHWQAASCNCSVTKPTSDGRLESFLESNRAFHISIAHIALTRLQEFLSKLISNIEQLKNC